MMKKIIALMLCVILVVCVLAACAQEEAAGSDDSAKFIGTWKSDDMLDDSYEFKEDGTGHYENFLIPYDFKWELKDGKLLMYAEMFGTTSDTATEYEYSFSGDKLTLTGDDGTSYDYIKQ